MESWTTQTPSPSLKFENSPAESFLSTPGDMYPPLFGSSSTTMNPLDIMTPKSYAEDRQPDLSVLTDLSGEADTPEPSDSPSSDKKQTKKRKSWGQVLPEPKTNLPPRKRAKTDDEKEQRRVERVLRNRRAAQSSRERKRLEVEALEERNKELEAMVRQVQQTNLALIEELRKVQRGTGVLSRTSPSFGPNPVTLSQELFSSHDGHSALLESGSRSIEELLLSTQANDTVNPASLSPSLTPVAEQDEEDEDDEEREAMDDLTPAAVVAAATVEKTFPDATQHPAAMLCLDLPCRSAEVSQQSWTAALALLLPLQLLMASSSAMLSIFQRPLMQIAMSLRAGSSLRPDPSILSTIIWLVTRPSPSRRPPTFSTSTTTSTTTSSTCSPPAAPPSSSSSTISSPMAAQPQTRPSSSLRLKSLRKILSSSPTLARPLLDATMAALRLASSERYQVDRVSRGGDAVAVAAVDESLTLSPQLLQGWPSGAQLPSTEVLLTLMWAITVEDRRIQKKQAFKSTPLKRLGRQSGIPRRAVFSPSASTNIN